MRKRRDFSKTVETVFHHVKTHPYVSAGDVADALDLRKNTVYRAMRRLREQSIGVHPTKNGYILSQDAARRDDVGFLRRLNGRRTSDFVALSAALPHIKHRWRSVSDRNNIGLALGGLVPPTGLLTRGFHVLGLLGKRVDKLKGRAVAPKRKR